MTTLSTITIDDALSLRDYANVAITGKVAADFQVIESYEVTNPATTAPVTLTEIGGGEYRISFTPTTQTTWTAHLIYNADGVFQEFIETYDVLSKRSPIIAVPPAPVGAQLTTMHSQMITRGDTPTWDLPIIDATGAPFDLTGSTVWFSVKQRFNLPDGDAVVSSSWVDGGASNGIIVDVPASGEISFGLTPEQSSELIASLYVADVQVLDPNDNVTTVWKLRLAVGAGTTDRLTVP